MNRQPESAAISKVQKYLDENAHRLDALGSRDPEMIETYRRCTSGNYFVVRYDLLLCKFFLNEKKETVVT